MTSYQITMNKLKAYKFRLYPNATQEVLLNKTM